MKSFLHISAAAIALAACLSFADRASADMTAKDLAIQWFKANDRDKDGYLTVEEVVTYETKIMKREDLDGDGKLSLQEYLAGIPSGRADIVAEQTKRFARMDADGDGFVTVEEMTVFYQAELTKADKDGDGKVTLEEWLSFTAVEAW